MNVTAADTTIDLRVPVAAKADIYADGLSEALSLFCVPLEQAQPGDIVGLVQPYDSNDNGVIALQQCELIYASDDADCPFERVFFLELPEDVQRKISFGVLRAQTIGVSDNGLWHATHHLDTEGQDNIHIEAFITPDFMIAALGDYCASVLEGRYEQYPLSQFMIEACFLGLIPRQVDSAHMAIELFELAKPMQRLANSLLPIPCRENFTVNIPLGPPDIQSIFNAK